MTGAIDHIRLADQEYATAMERGSNLLLKYMTIAQRRLAAKPSPDILVWEHRVTNGQSLEPGPSLLLQREQGARMLEKIQERDRMAEINRVSRDPCPYCGVRADIACSHSRKASHAAAAPRATHVNAPAA